MSYTIGKVVIKAMLGDEQFGKLMTFSKDEKFNNLYFSVEKE